MPTERGGRALLYVMDPTSTLLWGDGDGRKREQPATAHLRVWNEQLGLTKEEKEEENQGAEILMAESPDPLKCHQNTSVAK